MEYVAHQGRHIDSSGTRALILLVERFVLISLVAGVVFSGLVSAAASSPVPTALQRLDDRDGLPSSRAFAVEVDAAGLVWIGTQEGLARFDGQRVEVFTHDPDDPRSLPSDFVRVLRRDPTGELWIGTTGGLARW